MAGVTAGERYSLPVFFTTQPPPADAPWRDALGARPHDRAARAAALWERGHVENKGRLGRFYVGGQRGPNGRLAKSWVP